MLIWTTQYCTHMEKEVNCVAAIKNYKATYSTIREETDKLEESFECHKMICHISYYKYK